MNNLKFILTASIVAALTLSCSDEIDSSGGGSNTEFYTLKSKTADQFTYVEVYQDEDCEDGGILKIEEDTDEYTINYSIKNNIMTWEDEYAEDSLNFKGTSNELIGTWTRTKNKNASCEEKSYKDCVEYDYETYQCKKYEEEKYFSCKQGWNITKAVFTERNVSITTDYCTTDRMIEGQAWSGGDDGWRMRSISCDTYEIYKGTDKVTVKENRNNVEVSYKGKTCKMSEPTKAQKEAACKEAWNKYHQTEEYWDDYYYDILRKGFYDCLKKDMPKGFWVDDDDNSQEKVMQKFMPLSQNPN